MPRRRSLSLLFLLTTLGCASAKNWADWAEFLTDPQNSMFVVKRLQGGAGLVTAACEPACAETIYAHFSSRRGGSSPWPAHLLPLNPECRSELTAAFNADSGREGFMLSNFLASCAVVHANKGKTCKQLDVNCGSCQPAPNRHVCKACRGNTWKLSAGKTCVRKRCTELDPKCSTCQPGARWKCQACKQVHRLVNGKCRKAA